MLLHRLLGCSIPWRGLQALHSLPSDTAHIYAFGALRRGFAQTGGRARPHRHVAGYAAASLARDSGVGGLPVRGCRRVLWERKVALNPLYLLFFRFLSCWETC